MSEAGDRGHSLLLSYEPAHQSDWSLQLLIRRAGRLSLGSCSLFGPSCISCHTQLT